MQDVRYWFILVLVLGLCATTAMGLPIGNPTADPQITLGAGIGASGSEVRIPVFLTNTTGPAVGGLQMAIVAQGISHADFVRLEDQTLIPGFTIQANAQTAGRVNLVVFSNLNATIEPGADPIHLATLVYAIHANAELVSSHTLDIEGLLVGDPQGASLTATGNAGIIHVNIRGDMNFDGQLNILDVVHLSRILIGLDPEPEMNAIAFETADGNDDGSLDVVDLIYHINTILGVPNPPLAKLAQGVVTVSLGDVQTLVDGRRIIALTLDSALPIGGFQANLTYDPSVMRIESPFLTEGLSGIELMSRVSVAEGKIHLIAFRTEAETVLPSDGRPILLIPISVLGHSNLPKLSLHTVTVATVHAQEVQAVIGLGSIILPLDKSGLPDSFVLTGNTPNPFNPSTTISYEIPQQTHVQLVVYNLLGQEVVRLVNQVQQAGRYQIPWRAVNGQGLPVSSGVYLYRLICSTGYSEGRIMTLLK